jgi:hypothetical protein
MLMPTMNLPGLKISASLDSRRGWRLVWNPSLLGWEERNDLGSLEKEDWVTLLGLVWIHEGGIFPRES